MSVQDDLNQLTNLTTSQKAGTQNLLANQSTETSDYLKRYTDFINSQEGASAMAGRIGTELGIPGLQSNATMLRNTLTNLPSTYSKATTGYDVNANQLGRIIGQKSSELSPMVQTAETSLANAQNVLGTRMGYEQTDQAKALLPYTTEQSMLADRLAREQSMFTADNTNELNALIAKIQQGVILTNAEQLRANDLAIAEKGYQNELDKLNGAGSYINVGEGTAVYDPATGKMIYKNPKTSTPSTSGGGGNYYNTGAPQMSAPAGTIQGNYYSDGSQWYEIVP